MIKIKINGELKETEPVNVEQLITSLGYAPGKVAVEYNLVVLPRNLWNGTVLKDGDWLEIIGFVGGG